ncbi:MAG: serine/threonine protein kinase [Deltaproteobacteria bacterium]|nr:serine/threonine protein kinase [Deltaproteobacteria bacterium]
MSSELAPGEVIHDRFVLRRKIGVGGFGTVWLAEDGTNRSAVALKLLHPQHKRKTRTLERFVREAQVLTGLRHPNIANALTFSAEGPVPFIAMEFAPGHTLSAEIAARAKLGVSGAEVSSFAPSEIRSLLEALVAPVSHAHKKGVVHRDLKPENVVVFSDHGALRLKILDFGIAKILEDSAAMKTTVGRVFGSLFYMSPEQARGETVDARADVFGLGAILFELLTLRRAWARSAEDAPLSVLESPTGPGLPNKPLQVMQRISEGPRPRPSAWREGIGRLEDDLVLRSMAVRPDERFQSVDEFLEAVRAVFPASLDETGPTLSVADEPTEAQSRDGLLLATDPQVAIDTHPTNDEVWSRTGDSDEDPTRIGSAGDRPAWVDPWLAEISKDEQGTDSGEREGTIRHGSPPKGLGERSRRSSASRRTFDPSSSTKLLVAGSALIVTAAALVTMGVIAKVRSSAEPPVPLVAKSGTLRAVAAPTPDAGQESLDTGARVEALPPPEPVFVAPKPDDTHVDPELARPEPKPKPGVKKLRPPDLAKINKLLEDVRKKPSEAAARALSDAILEAAEAIIDPASRKVVLSCAKSGKLDELSLCVGRLTARLDAGG